MVAVSKVAATAEASVLRTESVIKTSPEVPNLPSSPPVGVAFRAKTYHVVAVVVAGIVSGFVETVTPPFASVAAVKPFKSRIVNVEADPADTYLYE